MNIVVKDKVMVSPLNIGDTVHIEGHRFPAEIQAIKIDEKGMWFEWAEYDAGPELTELWDDGEFGLNEIGKTVFLNPDEVSKVDWSKVAIDTPILISVDGKDWVERYFAGFEEGKVLFWGNGATSLTGHLRYVCEYAKLGKE